MTKSKPWWNLCPPSPPTVLHTEPTGAHFPWQGAPPASAVGVQPHSLTTAPSLPFLPPLCPCCPSLPAVLHQAGVTELPGHFAISWTGSAERQGQHRPRDAAAWGISAFGRAFGKGQLLNKLCKATEALAKRTLKAFLRALHTPGASEEMRILSALTVPMF